MNHSQNTYLWLKYIRQKFNAIYAFLHTFQALLDDLCKQIKELDPDAKTVCDESTDALAFVSEPLIGSLANIFRYFFVKSQTRERY